MLALYLAALEDEGDRALFVQIYERYERKMYAVALNILKEPRAAEDAVHDAMVKVITHFETVKKIISNERDVLEPWIVTVVKRTALDAKKKARFTRELPEGWEAPGGDSTQADSAFDALVELVKSMPEGYRAVLELRLVSEWGFQEIGNALGITPGAAQMRCSRGLDLLREKLREEGYGNGGAGV